MKNLVFFLTVFAFSTAIFAQEITDNEIKKDKKDEVQTLFGSVNSHGGYGGFGLRIGQLNGSNTVWNGGQGGWIINHALTLGGAGYGFVGESFTQPGTTDNYFLTGGFGGLLLEPIILPKFPVHISIPIIIGAGGVSIQEDVYTNNFQDRMMRRNNSFFVVSPGAEIEFNVIKFMRISAGAYYRYTTDINLAYSDGTPVAAKTFLNGLSYGITFKFGAF